eukprot:gene11488-biopygen8338
MASWSHVTRASRSCSFGRVEQGSTSPRKVLLKMPSNSIGRHPFPEGATFKPQALLLERTRGTPNLRSYSFLGFALTAHASVLRSLASLAASAPKCPGTYLAG